MELLNLHLLSILASCFWCLNLIILSVVCCAGLVCANTGIVVELFHHPDLISPLHCFSNVMKFTSLDLTKLNLRPPQQSHWNTWSHIVQMWKCISNILFAVGIANGRQVIYLIFHDVKCDFIGFNSLAIVVISSPSISVISVKALHACIVRKEWILI